MAEDQEVFVVRFTRRWASRQLLQLVALALFVALAWRLGILPAALAVVFGVLLGTVSVLVLLFARKATAQAVALCLDRTGLTFAGCPEVAWADVAGVVIGPLRPRRLLGSPRTVATFRPRPGVTPDGPGFSRASRSGALRRRLYGSVLVLPLFATDTTADDLASAVARLGGVPVERPPVPRTHPVLVVLLGVAGALLLALLLLVLWYVAG